MRLNRLVFAGLVLTIPTSPVVAQLRSSRPPPQVVNLPRLMIANPHSFSSQDSAAAVRIGAALRDRAGGIADRWYKVILRAQMNEALQQYAYPVDAVLPPMVARQLAQSLNARAMIVATVLRNETGRYTIEARLAGMNDDAGHMVRITQTANQAFEDFGARVGDSLNASFRALPDAKSCENLRATAPEKAAESAAKALRIQPNHGLAEYCLAQIAISKKLGVDSVIAHLKNSTKGDWLSLGTWTALAVQYQAKGDSTATIATFKEMLRVAPTNEALRKEAFKLFQNYGRPEAAEDVADAGLQLDPANADLWDLKSNACLDQGQTKPEKNQCAVDALERVYDLDSTKADTAFYSKISYAASLPPVDTAHFVKWTRLGSAKYPNQPFLLSKLAEAYSIAGPVDSAVAVTKRLVAVDSSDLIPVLRVAKTLADAKRGRDALEFSPIIDRLGSLEDKTNFALVLGQAAFPMLQPPPDYLQAADMARAALKMVAAGSRAAQLANFVLGLATFAQIPPLDPEAEKNKSCPIAQQMKLLLDEAGPALLAGRSINEATAARFITGVEGFTPRINSMIKAYCK
jgi:tetratricopeptide (TPR) repeat protein